MNVFERVPWICKQEWEYCRDQLFGDDLLMKQKALEHLYIWKVRCPNLPVAIECTLILMDVHLKGNHEVKSINEEILTNTMNFESWYSVAIMRFLNLITDSAVGSKSSSSMNELAKQYDIPEWIVEIRHSVAHGPLLPSLSSLRGAVERCLQWLYESYWSKDIYDDIIPDTDDDIGISSLTFQCFEICLLIKKYLLYGFQTTASIPFEDRERIHRILSAKTDEETDYSFSDWSLEDVHKSMLKRLSRHLKKDTKYGKYLVSEVLRTDQYLICPDALRNNEISRKFFNEWAEIISVLCSSNVCAHFLQGLIDIVISPLEDMWRRQCAAAYLNEILKNISLWKKQNYTAENIENDSVKRKKLKKKQISQKSKKSRQNQTLALSSVKLSDSDIWNIMDSVLEEPTPLIKVFLLNLINCLDSKLDSSKRNQIFNLINIYFGKKVSETSSEEADSDVYTLQRLLQKDLETGESMQIESEETPSEEVEHHSDPPLSAIKDLWDWSSTALGILPWQTDFEPWLLIYNTEE